MASDQAGNVDWSSVSKSMAREIMSQGEKYLQAQLQLAVAADQRATTMASLVASVAAAVVAGALAYWDKSGSIPILLAGLFGASALLVGAAFAAWAARPVEFYLPGNHPREWIGVANAPLTAVMGGEAENYQEHIEANDRILGANQGALKRAGLAVLLAPVVAVAAWGLASATCQTSFRAATSPDGSLQPSSSGGTLQTSR